MNEQLLERITLDPKVMTGKPVIRGTRIPVQLILEMLAQGISQQEILQEYSRLEPADIQAVLVYAARVIANETVFPIPMSKAAE